MPLHMIKLCVGADTVEDLEAWAAHRRAERREKGERDEQFHVTRVMPKRAEEILAGGSLFWVIRGQVQVRQPVLRFEPVRTEDGVERCRIILAPEFRRTSWLARRPFQGWRYLRPEDAPTDLGDDDSDVLSMPPALRRELAELGLI
ncbi:DUF1489 family protein [Aureimonas sp. AU4]|uniref:DUF1489 family protein n=1 Tax=Aureimonas sp. AU4 TaxID=1638163 RepID=UPI000784FCFC|nr:DUF1489 domain-containing protein [Aureimonas sp. AU4]